MKRRLLTLAAAASLPSARMRGYLGLLGVLLFLGAGLNFAAFLVVSWALGGANGHVEGGHYYLTDHGRRTEVSPRVWAYSRAHQKSVEITNLVGTFIGGGLMLYAFGHRRHYQRNTKPSVPQA